LKSNKVNIDNLYYLYETAIKNKNNQISEHVNINKNIDDINIKDISKIKNDASNLLNDAQTKSSQIHEEAILNAKLKMEAAQKEGYMIGLTEGRKQAENEIAVVLNEMLNIIQGLEEHKLSIYNNINSEAKDLALTVARKVIDEKISADDSIFLNLYKKSVQELINTDQKSVKLIISNHETAFVTSNLDYLISLSKGLEHIDIVVAKDAPIGTCIIETDNTIIDASAKTQFQILAEALSD
jgi:flagellar biosynthesis/type III secretory pathway protein FliH